MSWDMWRAKRLMKRIEKNEAYLIKLWRYKGVTKTWIKRDEKALNKVLKKLSKEDYLAFAVKNGFIEGFRK